VRKSQATGSFAAAARAAATAELAGSAPLAGDGLLFVLPHAASNSAATVAVPTQVPKKFMNAPLGRLDEAFIGRNRSRPEIRPLRVQMADRFTR
jgi:hypothetical protein